MNDKKVKYYFKNTSANDDNYKDYDIYYNNQKIGLLQIINKEDNIFIRQIRIFDNFKKKKHATNIVNELINQYKKDIVLCVATNSQSAISFWNYYLKNKNAENIRGEIYKIKVSTK